MAWAIHRTIKAKEPARVEPLDFIARFGMLSLSLANSVAIGLIFLYRRGGYSGVSREKCQHCQDGITGLFARVNALENQREALALTLAEQKGTLAQILAAQEQMRNDLSAVRDRLDRRYDEMHR